MLRIKFRKNYKGYKRGDIISVTNNEAVGFIELGVADTTTSFTSTESDTYEDKMVVSGTRKRYKTKGK